MHALEATKKDEGQVRLAIMQWVKKWKATMSELGKDAKIPDLWRMSALLEICPNDVKELMMMRLDEISEKCEENLQAKVVSHTTNKTEETRGGHRDFCRDGGRQCQWQRARRGRLGIC